MRTPFMRSCGNNMRRATAHGRGGGNVDMKLLEVPAIPAIPASAAVHIVNSKARLQNVSKARPDHNLSRDRPPLAGHHP